MSAKGGSHQSKDPCVPVQPTPCVEVPTCQDPCVISDPCQTQSHGPGAQVTYSGGCQTQSQGHQQHHGGGSAKK
ncbi:hypothetical protein XELAEV_18034950mg [Xenopus laevis]|uniref:Uncharacterized protein n=1 Tax=Xenopus laevis TaxID=8355 RepID=A0A974HBK7_XENLA|nr:hypothetical protein XELAEV_18034950mg [Xenopus laevis]